MKAAIVITLLVATSCGQSNDETEVSPPVCSCPSESCGCPVESCQCAAPICDCQASAPRAIGSVMADGTLLGLAGDPAVTATQRISAGRYWIAVEVNPAVIVQVTPRSKTVLVNYQLYAGGVSVETIDLSGHNVDCEFSFAIEHSAQMVP